ncbi:MAG: hypothetical protein GEU83_17725 [Pseudonocardiaceae bacterium]|nr:hypothetical protein [Pseudonocardiaceae bacterium]
MEKPSMVHNCSPPPGDELVKLGLRTGEVWVCPVCRDNWRLQRGVQPGGLLPISMQQPQWLRLNEYEDPPDRATYDARNPPP